MKGVEQDAMDYVRAHVERLAPLLAAANLASWEAATQGSDRALQRAASLRADVRQLYADPEGAALVHRWLADGEVHEPLLRRQLVLLRLAFAGNQLPAETIADLTGREAGLERVFYTYRAGLDGRQLSENELLQRLREETDAAERRRIWEAGRAIGAEVGDALRELARRRNDAARQLGYPDFYRMQLALQEIEEDALFALLDGFARRTDRAFNALRAELDRALAQRHDVAPDQLRPWHWDDLYCQNAPRTGGPDLDAAFADLDAVETARRYFAAVGLPVDDVLQRSDLFEREGKDQHAFCIDIDRRDDVRVLCNLRPDERWMSTLLHELGHAAYDKFVPDSLPFLVRVPAHTSSTEAIAMLMGRRTRDPAWLREHAGVQLSSSDAERLVGHRRLGMLVSTRWMLVMCHFERAFYADPDREDLNTLWWDLVERFQRVQRPDRPGPADWATKPHLSLSPVYYHNYLLGELTASQLEEMLDDLSDPGAGPRELGRLLRHRVFGRGALLPWDDLVRAATGAPLSPDAFARQFVD